MTLKLRGSKDRPEMGALDGDPPRENKRAKREKEKEVP